MSRTHAWTVQDDTSNRIVTSPIMYWYVFILLLPERTLLICFKDFKYAAKLLITTDHLFPVVLTLCASRRSRGRDWSLCWRRSRRWTSLSSDTFALCWRYSVLGFTFLDDGWRRVSVIDDNADRAVRHKYYCRHQDDQRADPYHDVHVWDVSRTLQVLIPNDTTTRLIRSVCRYLTSHEKSDVTSLSFEHPLRRHSYVFISIPGYGSVSSWWIFDQLRRHSWYDSCYVSRSLTSWFERTNEKDRMRRRFVSDSIRRTDMWSISYLIWMSVLSAIVTILIIIIVVSITFSYIQRMRVSRYLTLPDSRRLVIWFVTLLSVPTAIVNWIAMSLINCCAHISLTGMVHISCVSRSSELSVSV